MSRGLSIFVFRQTTSNALTAHVSITEKILATPSKLAQQIRQCVLADAVVWCFYLAQWRWRESIDYRCFDKELEYLQPIGRQDGLLEYGCGLRSAVIILAVMHPFGRVMGFGLDAKPVRLANEPIRRVGDRGRFRAGAVEILPADAIVFQLPVEVNHILPFNSLAGDVLGATLARVRRSLERHPRRLKSFDTQPIGEDDPVSRIVGLRLDRELSTGYWMHVRSRAYTNVAYESGSKRW